MTHSCRIYVVWWIPVSCTVSCSSFKWLAHDKICWYSEHCFLTRWSLACTSMVRGFNYHCIIPAAHLPQEFLLKTKYGKCERVTLPRPQTIISQILILSNFIEFCFECLFFFTIFLLIFWFCGPKTFCFHFLSQLSWYQSPSVFSKKFTLVDKLFR